MKFYTGVGSRKTPSEILQLMVSIAIKLAAQGFILRSGGAAGADTAFARGAGRRSNIFRPEQATFEAMELAAQFHPAWHRVGANGRRLHGRNAFQVLGRDLQTPSRFVICWTPDGCISHKTRRITTGGTGTAISIADHYGVPVFNLAIPQHLKRLKDFAS